MKNRRTFFLIISFVLALVLSISVYAYLSSLENKTAEVKQFDIIVASVEIPQYTKITETMIQTIKVLQLPEAGMAYYSDPKELIGKYSGERILQGEQFFKSRILENAEDNLSLKLTGNHRAVSVMANSESGVSKFIKAGDYIDILVTMPELKDGEEIIRPDISKMILQKILVLAVDKDTTTSTAPAEDEAAKKEESSGEGIFYLTLSVPVFDIERLTLAEDLGGLKFALRPKTDNYIYPTDGAIWQEMLLDEQNRIKDINPNYQVKPAGTATTSTVEKPAATKPTTTGSKPSTTKPSTTTTTKPSTSTTTTTTEKPAEKYIYYVVKKGDTLRTIAEKFLGDRNKSTLLQQINHIPDPDMILPGTGIKIPVTK